MIAMAVGGMKSLTGGVGVMATLSRHHHHSPTAFIAPLVVTGNNERDSLRHYSTTLTPSTASMITAGAVASTSRRRRLKLAKNKSSNSNCSLTPSSPSRMTSTLTRTFTSSSTTTTSSSSSSAASPASLGLTDEWLVRSQAFIGGQWVDAAGKETFDVHNPATEELLGSVPAMGAEDAKKAIQAATEAWATWKKSSTKQRETVLKKWSALCRRHADDLAKIMTLECGKPFAESKGEVMYGVSFLEFFAEETKRANGMVIPSPSQSQRILTIKQPVGVCSLVTPWNFPFAMISRKVGPALAAGCTAVIKPAEDTPLTALAMVRLAEKAGVPAGVLNIITTARGKVAEVGEELCTNPDVRKVSFTGSTAVGKILLEHASGTVKKVSMELGGNAPFVVFADADIDRAVEGAVASKFRFSGQTCVCTNRFLVQAPVYDAFVEKLAAKVSEFIVGNGMDPRVNIGPLINEGAQQKVTRLVEESVKGGARVVTGGAGKADFAELGSKRFFQPTVLADCTPNMPVCWEEIFGPVAAILKFETEEEALAMANSPSTGLAAYFYTSNLARVFRFSEALEVGMVGVNEGIISKEVAPFGGVKESGLGREGSVLGIEEYMEVKFICLGGLQ